MTFAIIFEFIPLSFNDFCRLPPRSVSKFVSSQFKSRSELIEENERLSAENFLQRADIMHMQALEAENEALRKLLNSPSSKAPRRQVAEVIDVDSNPYLRRVIINRGSKSGVISRYACNFRKWPCRTGLFLKLRFFSCSFSK